VSNFSTLTMKVVSSSETSINIYQTKWCNIPEDSDLKNPFRHAQ
jgi:hypothetical protein